MITEGFIYVIRMDGTPWVKIGYTAKPRKRLTYIRLVMPSEFRFTVVAAFPGGYAEESALHMRFLDEFDQGEWYRLTPRIQAFIAEAGIHEDYRLALGKTHLESGGRGGRPRTISHIDDYQWCPCADCRKERATA